MKCVSVRSVIRGCVWPTLAGCLLLAPARSVVAMPQADATELQTPDTVLLEFQADWCGPCRRVSPTVDALAAAGYRVERIDVDRQPTLAARYAVENIPCFVAVRQGRETGRIVGGCSYQQLETLLKRGTPTKRTPNTATANLQPETLDLRSPKPAWRYERAVGPRAAIVRIYSQVGATSRSIGSGTLVKWNGRIVVLTARHVVKDARKITIELSTKRTLGARVVKADAVWDCAVLELSGDPVGVTPAELELGDAAMQRDGDRLDSCGYGADGRLACNSGLFLGYRRSAEAAQGPDDWFIISGHARGGDSGGPVFNAQGRVVGVLWGTDGREVVCVQAGRLHRLLDAAVPAPKPLKAEQLTTISRNPTPAKESACGCPVSQESPTELDATASYGKKQPLMKWRDGAQQKDDLLDARIEALIALQERQARAAVAAALKPAPPANEPAKIDAKDDQASPGVAAVCMAGAIGLAAALYYWTSKEE